MSVAKEMMEQLRGNNLESSTPVVLEDGVETTFFGLEPNQKFPTALDLRFKNGSCRAYPYTYISELEFDPSDGIFITALGRKIHISGRNLKPLYEKLVAYRVRFIQENIGGDTFADNQLFVEGITVDEV